MDGKKYLDYVDSYGDHIQVSLVLNMYQDNDNLFVGLESYDEELEMDDNYCNLTVNIGALPYLYGTIDTTYSGAEKMKFIQEQGLAEPIGESLRSGFCIYPIVKFNEEKLKEIDPVMYEKYAKAHGIEIKEALDRKISKAEAAQQGTLKEEKTSKAMHPERE